MEYNEANANVRTLIVSFVLAIFALIPLRFYEVSQNQFNNYSNVLGAQQELRVSREYRGEVVNAAVLEAPYNLIEQEASVDESRVQVLGANSDCISADEANQLLTEATSMRFTDEEKDMLINELAKMQICE